MTPADYKTIFDLCEDREWEREYSFKLKGGRVLWEAASMRHSESAVISRICEANEGGKTFLMGLNYKRQYVHPDTKIELVKK